MARIARLTPDHMQRFRLAYYALYACDCGPNNDPAACVAACSIPFDMAFVLTLTQNIPDREPVRGWIFGGVDGDRVPIEKDGIRSSVAKGLITHLPSAIGHEVSFTLPSLSVWSMPGFVLRHGRCKNLGVPFSRIYLNIAPHNAIWALGDLARRFDNLGHNFSVKVLAHPRAYVRRDACLMYIASDEAEGALGHIYDSLSRNTIVLREGVPLFTQTLSTGLGFADDPAEFRWGQISHGEWVCNLFVEAARETEDARVIAKEILWSLDASGRDPACPGLRSGRTISEFSA